MEGSSLHIVCLFLLFKPNFWRWIFLTISFFFEVIGQYPDLFSAAVLRNPVISVGEMSSTDILDWYFSEFGIEYPLSSSSPNIINSIPDDTPPTTSAQIPPLVSSEIYTNLLSVSPISHVDSIKAPVLLLIGSADRRVATSQGVNFYHALKARYASEPVDAHGRHVGSANRKIEMLVFEGEGHPLDGVEAAKVCFDVTRKWLVSAAAGSGNVDN